MYCTQCGEQVVREDEKWYICPTCNMRFLIEFYEKDRCGTCAV